MEVRDRHFCTRNSVPHPSQSPLTRVTTLLIGSSNFSSTVRVRVKVAESAIVAQDQNNFPQFVLTEIRLQV